MLLLTLFFINHNKTLETKIPITIVESDAHQFPNELKSKNTIVEEFIEDESVEPEPNFGDSVAISLDAVDEISGVEVKKRREPVPPQSIPSQRPPPRPYAYFPPQPPSSDFRPHRPPPRK